MAGTVGTQRSAIGEKIRKGVGRVSGMHPRPQLTRSEWVDLQGEWDFLFDEQDMGLGEGWWRRFPSEPLKIIVPFPPEAPASGIGDTSPHRVVWYRRRVVAPPLSPGERLVLHIGACDYAASVWCNGQLVARHEGGHTPFSCELSPDGASDGLEIVIRAEDDPEDISQPRGKQDWAVEPHGVWYPRTTGLWQPVWLEVLPSRYIAAVTWRPDPESGLIGCEVILAGKSRTTEQIAVHLTLEDEALAEQAVAVRSDRARFAIPLDRLANGVDRDRLFWSPEKPNLVNAKLELLGAGDVVDQVGSYFGIRTVGTKDGHFLLNGQPYFLRLVLEQGLWPESYLAAPSEAALRDEVELIKRLGFNGARLHQKIEDPRFLSFCDRLGLLVWEEMPSCYSFNATSVLRLSREWGDVVVRDRSHPSVVAWVPLNESWGVPDIRSRADQQSLALALVNLARALDGSRPVVSNDGWEHVDSDIWTVHDYTPDAGTLLARYGSSDALEKTLSSSWPGRHPVLLASSARAGRPVMLTEFGGIGISSGTDDAWHAYTELPSADAYAERFAQLVGAVLASPDLAGFCYTQLTDTFQEHNGLVRADRTPKVPEHVVRAAVAGARGPRPT
jgi:beta-galactosidase/beta-glucuronidase